MDIKMTHRNLCTQFRKIIFAKKSNGMTRFIGNFMNIRNWENIMNSKTATESIDALEMTQN